MSSFSNTVSDYDYNMLEDGLMVEFTKRSTSRKDQKQFRQRHNNKLIRDLSIREIIGNITKKEQKTLNSLQKRDILKQFYNKKILTGNAIVRHRDTKWSGIIYTGEIYTYTQDEIAERDEIPDMEPVDTERYYYSDSDDEYCRMTHSDSEEESSYHMYIRERKLKHFVKATKQKKVHFDEDLPVYIM
jgi:hypothetical protein